MKLDEKAWDIYHKVCRETQFMKTPQQHRLDCRNELVAELASKLPDKTGMSRAEKLRAVRLNLVALEAENLIKNYLYVPR